MFLFFSLYLRSCSEKVSDTKAMIIIGGVLGFVVVVVLILFLLSRSQRIFNMMSSSSGERKPLVPSQDA